MTYEYSVEIHSYFNEKLTIAAEKKNQAGKKKDIETIRFYEGQEKELLSLKKFITEKMDLITLHPY